MKYILISDTHFGARDDKVSFHDYFKKFYHDIFFPYIEENGITEIIHLGDFWDRRKFINYNTLKLVKEYFLQPIQESTTIKKVYTILGNHDVAKKNTNEINSPSLLLSEYDKISVIETPTKIGLYITAIPWVNQENIHDCMKIIKSSSGICCGHFDIKGFQMYNGVVAHEGLDSDIFKKFEIVFSGHFHHRSKDGNIIYLGSPYEITHADYNDSRGFYVIDDISCEYEFIQNPYTMFAKIDYDEDKIDVNTFDYSQFRDKYLKIVVSNRNDIYKYDLFVDKIYKCGCHDIKIIENIANIDCDIANSDTVIDISDTLTLINHYVQNSNYSVDVGKYMNQLYTEAINQ